MKISRFPCVFSASRARRCRELFRHPGKALLALGFVSKKPRSLTLKDGATASFSRKDARFWDWFLDSEIKDITFTEKGEVVFGYYGKKIVVRPGSKDFYVFREIFLQDEYSVNDIEEPLDVILDIGANVGMFSLAVLNKAKRVVSVEPVHANYIQALKHVELNNGRPEDVWRYAITKESGQKVTIYHEEGNTGGHSLNRGWVERVVDSEQVEGISLADLMKRVDCERVDLLKCDVEGGEYDIFLHTPSEILKKVHAILMEVHVSESYPVQLLQNLIDYLEKAGFSIGLEKELAQLSARRQSMILTATRPQAARQVG